ncbi:MAG: hypothetical protein RIB31_04650 [Thalassobaculaceae bacterium]
MIRWRRPCPAAWFCSLPYDECAALAKHVAFYGDKVEVREA